MSKNNIVLIGYMGAGKTTVGHLLAEKCNMAFSDTDDLISAGEKSTINDIFDIKGEPYFRELETKLLKGMCIDTENTVISCGGGMPLLSENRTYLKKLGIVIYLKAAAETVYERLKDDTERPLLRGDRSDALERISAMLEKRNPSYEEASDIIIDVSDISATKAAEIISEAVSKIK